jgi:hypothetical protein
MWEQTLRRASRDNAAMILARRFPVPAAWLMRIENGTANDSITAGRIIVL